MTVDQMLTYVRNHGFKLQILQQCGDGMWQASLRSDTRQFLPAKALSAAEALATALKHATGGKTASFRVEDEPVTEDNAASLDDIFEAPPAEPEIDLFA